MKAVEELRAIEAKLREMDPPSRLRLAADLIESQRPSIAIAIIRMVADELGIALRLATLFPPQGR